jgi:X-Pro dipeptidyl-peptidase-like protein
VGPYDSETAQTAVVEELFGAPAPSVARRATFAPAPTAARMFECGIPMRDGIELAADVHLPAESALPAPTVVKGTPYDKREPHHYLREARLYQDAGYGVVIYDVRGRGKSEGEWRAFVNDPRDGHDAVGHTPPNTRSMEVIMTGRARCWAERRAGGRAHGERQRPPRNAAVAALANDAAQRA